MGLLSPTTNQGEAGQAAVTENAILPPSAGPLGGDAPSWIAIGLAAVLIFAAFGGERLMRLTPGLGRHLQRVFQRVMARTSRWPGYARALALGAFTPLLPCGVLYAVYAASAATGTWSDGSLTALGFAAGSLPLLAAVQIPMAKLSSWLGPKGMARLRMVALLTAAAALLWRGIPPLLADGTPTCCTPN